MKRLAIFALLTLSLLSATNVCAFEFYGASVSDQEVPSAYMKWGIIGARPIVVSVMPDSPAELAGFARGNIILSVNGTNVSSSSELGQFSTDKINVLVFSGDEQTTLTIDRFAYEAEQASRASATSSGAIAPSAPPPAAPSVVESDSAPPVVLDNATIDEVYGAATPEQRALEAQRAEQIRLDNERNLRLEQDRALQRRSVEGEQERQRQEAERTRQREEAEGRAGEGEQKRSDEMRRDENRRDLDSRGRR
jgi:hypothetical protein